MLYDGILNVNTLQTRNVCRYLYGSLAFWPHRHHRVDIATQQALRHHWVRAQENCPINLPVPNRCRRNRAYGLQENLES